MLLVRRTEENEVLDPSTLGPTVADRKAVLAAARGLVPGAHIQSVETLTQPDLYWYDVAALPPLPVLRIEFDDRPGPGCISIPPPARSWATPTRAAGCTAGSTICCTSGDLNLLTLNRPAWDIFLWLFSLAGLVTSITAIRIGWSRLTRRPARQSDRRAAPTKLENDYA